MASSVQQRVKEELEDQVEPFNEVVSLGSLCAAAAWLQDHGLRAAAFPFDWVHSSPAMVRHCVRDNFEAFMDPRNYFYAGSSEKGLGEAGFVGVGHKIYSSMLLGPRKQVVWRHHDPKAKTKDFQLLQRCVERFRRALHHTGKRRFFLLLELVHSAKALQIMHDGSSEQTGGDGAGGALETGGPHFGGDLEVRGLFNDFCMAGVKRFHLEVVRLCIGGASKAKSGRQPVSIRHLDDSSAGLDASETLTIHELHCVGGHTGLRFKSALDEALLTSTLLGTGTAERKFDIGPSNPNKPRRSLSGRASQQPRRGRNYGDDGCFGTQGTQPESVLNFFRIQTRRRSSCNGSFLGREATKRRRLVILEKAFQNKDVIEVPDSDDNASPLCEGVAREDARINSSVDKFSRPQERTEPDVGVPLDKAASSESRPQASAAATSPKIKLERKKEFHQEVRHVTKRRLRGKQPLPGGEAFRNRVPDQTKLVDLNATSLGHTLRPVELGLRVAVIGNGWGEPGPGYIAVVTEADDYTFTVVGTRDFQETYVLREYCTVLSRG